jgi:hypothetical protein
MKNLLYIIIFLILGCTPETIIETEVITKTVTKTVTETITEEVYIEVPVTVYVEPSEPTIDELRDTYYSGDFNGADYYVYFEIFMWEAKNYGLDLDYTLEYPIIIEPRTHQNPNFVAWAKERDNDEKIHIGINTELFFSASRSNRARLYIMFHELGHDILNLPHLPTNSCSNITHIMNPCGRNDIDTNEFKQLVKELFEGL